MGWSSRVPRGARNRRKAFEKKYGNTPNFALYQWTKKNYYRWKCITSKKDNVKKVGSLWDYED